MAGASLNSIKTRLKSVESTRQITKAMELVSTSKLRRAKEKAEGSRAYHEELSEALSGIGTLGGKPKKPVTLTLLGGDEPLERSVIVIDKRSHTPPQFPRAYARISSKPL